jgi:hypothetical protein
VVRGVGSGDEDTVREAKAGRVSRGGEDDRGVRMDDSEAERCERRRMRSGRAVRPTGYTLVRFWRCEQRQTRLEWHRHDGDNYEVGELQGW